MIPHNEGLSVLSYAKTNRERVQNIIDNFGIDTPRKYAQFFQHTTYAGSPCVKCNSTKRQVRSSNCVNCHNQWQRDKRRSYSLR